jgi:P-type Cu+ transporter
MATSYSFLPRRSRPCLSSELALPSPGERPLPSAIWVASMATTFPLLRLSPPIPGGNPPSLRRLRPIHCRRWAPASSHSQRLRLPTRGAPAATPHATADPSTSVDSAAAEAEGAATATVLLDVSGMMCGGCAARVRAILAADARVETAAVNLLAESAAVRLRSPAPGAGVELAARLTECGFLTTARRGGAAGDSARKWREMAARKEDLLARSRGRVALAWTLVALCCGSHETHLLHSLGIHIGHGELEFRACGQAMWRIKPKFQ